MWDDTFDELLRSFLPFLSEDEPLGVDLPMREHGLDSLGMVELMSRLEGTYDVRFVDEALSVETFETPAVLWTALQALRQPSGALGG